VGEWGVLHESGFPRGKFHVYIIRLPTGGGGGMLEHGDTI